MNTEKFVEHINKLRLANKNTWFCDKGTVNGKAYEIKCFNTYAQKLYIDGIDFSTSGDMKIRHFKEALQRAADYNGIRAYNL